jgi:hypothetical protein
MTQPAATPTPSDPIALAYKYQSDPVDYENALYSKEAGSVVHDTYSSYLEQRGALNARFWRTLAESATAQKAAVAALMVKEPAYEQLRGYDAIRIV